jgi:hypothetical protein
MSATRSSTYTPNMLGMEMVLFRAISTGRMGSAARPSKTVQANPARVAA